MNIATRLIHSGNRVQPAAAPLSVPLYHASTYAQQSVDEFGAWDYARTGNRQRFDGTFKGFLLAMNSGD